MLNSSASFCSHDIKLKNLFDGDVVNYSLLLINGSVTNPIHGSSNLIHLSVGNESACEGICSDSGNFKLILDLSPYWSSNCSTLALNFKYCQTEKETVRITLDSHTGPYCLQPIYILCRDEEQNNLAKLHCNIIDVNLRLIQALYADRIQKAGLPKTTFALNGDCCIYRADMRLTDAWAASEQTLWNNLAEELLRKNRFEDENRKLKLVAFIGCTKYDGMKKKLQAHAALGGGDFALFGSAFFYAWPRETMQIVPCLLNQKTVNTATEADESNFRKTYGGVYASTLGAVCHEIGHIFDLGHDDGIMGTGLDFVNRVLTINDRTENLPKRIFENPSSSAKLHCTSSRVTQFIKQNENFLENYRKQRENDGFYFTRNCALILAHHKWLSKRQTLDKCDNSHLITYSCESGLVQSKVNALKIIEIRSNSSSLVDQFYEVEGSTTLEYKIPRNIIVQRQNTHYLFVMSINGISKRFEL